MAERLAAINDRLGPKHPIVPIRTVEKEWWTVGVCAICLDPVYVSGDYRGGRWRHGVR